MVNFSTWIPDCDSTCCTFVIACDYSCADWGNLSDHLAYLALEDIFKVSSSAADTEFCE